MPKAPTRTRRALAATIATMPTSTRIRKATRKGTENQEEAAMAGELDSTQTLMALVRTLVETVGAQRAQLEVLNRQHREQIEKMEEHEERRRKEMEDMRAELTAMIQTQIDTMQIPTGSAQSYAAVARTPPWSSPSNLSSTNPRSSMNSATTSTLYCTIDTTRVEKGAEDKTEPGKIREAVEKGVRAREGMGSWRCVAVTRDPRYQGRVRITARDEAELEMIKEVASRATPGGARVMRDQLYPVKVDNANRAAILGEGEAIRPETMKELGEENEVSIAKMVWLSRKDTAKQYGTMVVYVTRGSDAARLLQGQYFHIAGESAYTRVYEVRKGPTQCYNCQEMNHKAFACTRRQRCGKCAEEGHNHHECAAEIPKCALCGGPHEAYSRNCRKLHPTQDAERV
jgi:hypothetical protein